MPLFSLSSTRPAIGRLCRLALCAALLAATAATPAWAHRSRVQFGIGVNVGPAFGPYYGPSYYNPFWQPWYTAPPVIYQPPVVIRQEAPPVYVERTPVIAMPPAPVVASPPAPQPAQYWYYCPSSKAYYPHVPTCPEEWLRVLPQEQ